MEYFEGAQIPDMVWHCHLVKYNIGLNCILHGTGVLLGWEMEKDITGI